MLIVNQLDLAILVPQRAILEKITERNHRTATRLDLHVPLPEIKGLLPTLSPLSDRTFGMTDIAER